MLKRHHRVQQQFSGSAKCKPGVIQRPLNRLLNRSKHHVCSAVSHNFPSSLMHILHVFGCTRPGLDHHHYWKTTGVRTLLFKATWPVIFMPRHQARKAYENYINTHRIHAQVLWPITPESIESQRARMSGTGLQLLSIGKASCARDLLDYILFQSIHFNENHNSKIILPQQSTPQCATMIIMTR